MENIEKIVREITRKTKEIEAKEAEISRLQEDVRGLKFYVEGMNQSLKLINPSATAVKKKIFSLRSGTELAQVRAILLENDAPLHINDILKALGKEDDLKAKTSLGGSLNQYSSEGKVFTKTGPNIFGLIEKSYAEDFDNLEF